MKCFIWVGIKKNFAVLPLVLISRRWFSKMASTDGFFLKRDDARYTCFSFKQKIFLLQLLRQLEISKLKMMQSALKILIKM